MHAWRLHWTWILELEMLIEIYYKNKGYITNRNKTPKLQNSKTPNSKKTRRQKTKTPNSKLQKDKTTNHKTKQNRTDCTKATKKAPNNQNKEKTKQPEQKYKKTKKSPRQRHFLPVTPIISTADFTNSPKTILPNTTYPLQGTPFFA